MANTLLISRNDNKKLSEHFTSREWYSTSRDAPPSHIIYAVLLEAAEYLRNYFGVPWRITSTYRTEAHERQILAKEGVEFFVDEHMKGKAFDSQPATQNAAKNAAIMQLIAQDFLANGEIYQALRKIGITGFGLYNTFIHLDCRDSNFRAKRKDSFGFVACWDSRKNVSGARFGGAAFTQKKSVLRTSQTPTQGTTTSPSKAQPVALVQFTVARRAASEHTSR